MKQRGGNDILKVKVTNKKTNATEPFWASSVCSNDEKNFYLWGRFSSQDYNTMDKKNFIYIPCRSNPENLKLNKDCNKIDVDRINSEYTYKVIDNQPIYEIYETNRIKLEEEFLPKILEAIDNIFGNNTNLKEELKQLNLEICTDNNFFCKPSDSLLSFVSFVTKKKDQNNDFINRMTDLITKKIREEGPIFNSKEQDITKIMVELHRGKIVAKLLEIKAKNPTTGGKKIKYKKTTENITFRNINRVVYTGPRNVKYVRYNKTYMKVVDFKRLHSNK